MTFNVCREGVDPMSYMPKITKLYDDLPTREQLNIP